VGYTEGRSLLGRPVLCNDHERVCEMVKKNRSFSFSRSAKSLQENASNAGAVAGASYTLVGGIILLGGLGYLLDKWQGTGPWGLVIGLALGIIVGFYELVKTTTPRR